jgi:tetratricopeptide (TPR) repeat protein
LDQIQRSVFARLAVFGGRNFSIDAVTAIAEMDYFEALDRLDALVALSLLNDVGDERYRQHALLADFAHEKLGQDDAPYQRMIAYYQAFAAGHNEDYAALELEWENLSASVEQAYQLTMWPTVITLTDTLRPAWFTRGRYAEARLAFPRMEEAANNCEDKPTTATCLLHWGCACNEQSDYEEAAQLLSRSLKIFEEIRNQPGIADAKFELARIAIEQMNLNEADTLLADVHQMRKDLGDHKGIASVLYRQARVAYRRDNQELAQQLLQESLSIQEQIGDRAGSMPVLRLLATVVTAVAIRDFSLAEECYYRVLNLSEELGDQNERALALRGLSRVCLENGNLPAALEYAQESLDLLQRIGDRKAGILALRQISKVKAAMGEYETALQLAEKCLHLGQEFNDGLLYGYIRFEMGNWYIKLNKVGLAQNAYRESLRIGELINNSFLLEKSQAELVQLEKSEE